MVLLISDLHLQTDAYAPSIDATRLIRFLDDTCTTATASKTVEIRLILLGDIFELLKSKIWIDRRLRPWETCTAAHVAAVSDIMASIIAANGTFFDGLNRLQTTFSFLEIEYVAGNHDRPLGTDMGAGARELLARKLPRLRFRTEISEARYGLYARHGHEFDPHNRYTDSGPALGDAVVIDILVAFAEEARKAALDDRVVTIINEVDNVRPNVTAAVAAWMRHGLESCPIGTNKPLSALHDAASETLKGFRKSLKAGGFAGTATARWWIQLLSEMVKLRVGRFQALDAVLAGNRPAAALADHSPARYVQILGKPPVRSKRGHSYYVSGHTHLPEMKPVNLGKAGGLLYLNTGTWRSVHHFANGMVQGSTARFTSWREECVVVIHSPEEIGSGSPPYEFRRVTHGI
jgi:UDP-2,3-diacylglucosamine pyrophosphatase LpxH